MGHLARVGARRRPAQPSFELVYSLSVCQLFRLSRFVPDFDVSGKTAEPKMAFNFAHLLSAACGGAPHRLRRLRRPWRRAVRAPLCGFRGGLGSRKSRFVPDFDVSGKTAEPKMAFNFAHLLSAACGGAARRLRALRARFFSLFLSFSQCNFTKKMPFCPIYSHNMPGIFFGYYPHWTLPGLPYC